MRRLSSYRLIPLLIVIAVLAMGASCGTSSSAALLVTGEAIKGVGQDWLAVNKALVQACKPSAPTLDAVTCAQARAFAIKFKQAYPVASELYYSAVRVNDIALAGDAKSAVSRLAVEALTLAVKVGMSIREVK